MANRTLYMLFGFCPELDWKPTAFVGPISPSRVCSSCRRIPMSGLLLPCEDLMCLPCFEIDEKCPVHEIAFPEKELQRTTFPLRYMMQRKVYCWNSSKGCDAVGTLSFMLEHYEKDCPIGAAPAHTKEGTAELGRHSSPERLTVPRPEQRTRNVLKEVRGATSKNESLFEDDDIASLDDFVVESSGTTPATSHSIALSTHAGSPIGGVHSSVRIRVDTRSTHNAATRAERGSRNTGTTRAPQKRAHEPTRKDFENVLEHGRTINADPVSFNQQTDAEQYVRRRSRSSNVAGHNEDAVFLDSGGTAAAAACSKPQQEGTLNITSNEAMEAVSKSTEPLGDAKAAGTASDNCPNEPFSRQLQETQHCESPEALSMESDRCSGSNEAVLMDCFGSTQRRDLGEGPTDTPVTALVSDDSRECYEASRENEPPADHSVKVLYHQARDCPHERNIYFVSDSSSITSGSSGDCEGSLEGTESNDDAFSNTVYGQETGCEGRFSVHGAPSEGTKNMAEDDTKLEAPQDSEVGLKATSVNGSAQERPVRAQVASTRMSSEEVCEQPKRMLNVPSLRPAVAEGEAELCETEVRITRKDSAEAFHHASEGSALEAQMTGALCTSGKEESGTFQLLERTLANRLEPADSPVTGGRVERSELGTGVLTTAWQLPEIGVPNSEQRSKCPEDPKHACLRSVTDQSGQYQETARSANAEETTTGDSVMPPGPEKAEGPHAELLHCEHSGHNAAPVIADGPETFPVEPVNDFTASSLKDVNEKLPQEGLASGTSGSSKTKTLQDFAVFEPRRLLRFEHSRQDCQKKRDFCSTSKNTPSSVPSFMMSEKTLGRTDVEQPGKLDINLPLLGSYHGDDRSGSQLSNRVDNEKAADSQRYREGNSSHQLSDEVFKKLIRGSPQSATGYAGTEHAFLDSESTTNSTNFSAILDKLNDAMENISKAKHFRQSRDAIASPSSGGEVTQESCQRSVDTDALNSQSRHTGSDQQIQLTHEDSCPEADAASNSEVTQSDCPDDRDAEPTFGRSVTGKEGRTVPSDEATIEKDADTKDHGLSRASVFNVTPSPSTESVPRTSSDASFSSSFSRNVTVCFTQQEMSCTQENRGTKSLVHKVIQSSQLFRRNVTLAPSAGNSLSGQIEERPIPAPFSTSSSEETTHKATEQSSEDFVAASLMRDKPEEAAICQDVKHCRRAQENHQGSHLCDQISPLAESPSDSEKTKTEHIKVLMSTKLTLDAVLAATKESLDNHTGNTGALQELQEAIRRSTSDVINVCKAMLHSSFGNFASFEWYVENCGEIINRTMQVEYLSLESPSPHYFCGYNIRPSIFLRKRKGIIEIHPELTLYKGVYDDFIKWPFDGKCKLVIVHPCGATEDVVISMDYEDKRAVPLAFRRPKALRNIGVYAQGYHLFQDVENRGFVSDNRLRLRFEVFSPS